MKRMFTLSDDEGDSYIVYHKNKCCKCSNGSRVRRNGSTSTTRNNISELDKCVQFMLLEKGEKTVTNEMVDNL